jgi:hypothetical protein
LRDRRGEYIAAGRRDENDGPCWDRLAEDFEKALDHGVVERPSKVDNSSNCSIRAHAPLRIGDGRAWTKLTLLYRVMSMFLD